MLHQYIIDLKVYTCLCIAAVAAIICDLVGLDTLPFKFLLVLMTFDYVTGLLVAAIFHKSSKTKSGKLSSLAGSRGLLKKMGVLLAVYMGVQLELLTNVTIAADIVVLYYIGIEGISVLENLGTMGVKYPKKLRKALDALCEEGDCED